MTQEEKQLLLKDLSARLSYDVKIQGTIYEDILDRYGDETGEVNEEIVTFTLYIIGKNSIMYNGRWIPLESCKPYLRPMSSMTEDEWDDFNNYRGVDGILMPIANELDWLNKNHFDYRGLIEKGLALEAHKNMYETK